MTTAQASTSADQINDIPQFETHVLGTTQHANANSLAKRPRLDATADSISHPPVTLPRDAPLTSLLDVTASSKGGGKAGRAFYQTLELRQKVLQLLDRPSLARMIRVERGAVASVAEILYKHIHTSVVSKMIRSSPRRDVYSHAVRTIDRSPLPHLTFTPTPSLEHNPVRIVPEALLDILMGMRMAFPNLHTILFLHPANELDDSFVAHLHGESISVDLQTPVVFDLHVSRHPPAMGEAGLPPSPQCAGMDIRQGISIKLLDSGFDALPDIIIARWKTWLFENVDLDTRVNGIFMSDDLRVEFSITQAETVTFLNQRNANPICLPIRHFELSLATECALERITEVAPQLSELRSLLIDMAGQSSSGLPAIIAALDIACPQLLSLTIAGRVAGVHGAATTIPLSGMPSLRFFEFCGSRSKTKGSARQPIHIARYLQGLGTRDCVYRIFDTEASAQAFHTLLKKLKFRHPEYHYLHSIHPNSLDLSTPFHPDWVDFDFPPLNQLRRLAWPKTAHYAAELSDLQKNFDRLCKTQSAVGERLLCSLVNTLDELVGTEGNPIKQGKILKRRFGVMEKQGEDSKDALEEIQKMCEGMITVSSAAAIFIRDWLGPRP